MTEPDERAEAQTAAVAEIDSFRHALGPFVVAASETRMAMVFTNPAEPDEPIVYVNDSFLNLTGFHREQILGKGLGFVLADLTDRSAAEVLHAARDHRTGTTAELECRRRDGSTFLAALFFSPVRDADGTIVQNFMSLVELGGQFASLRRERDELFAIYNDAPGFIARTEGRDHRFVFANRAYERLVGRQIDKGMTVAAALPEAAEQGFVALLDRVFETGEPFVGANMPIRLRRGSDEHEIRYITFVYQPVRDVDGYIVGLFSEGHDVTEQQEAADKVAELQNEVLHLSRLTAMGTMATTLAHEINQPLVAITNFAAAARRLAGRDGTGEELDECLAGIATSAHRAGEMIRHLREMTRRGKPQWILFELKPAISECIRLVRAGACGSPELHDLSTFETFVFADRIQIQQVIINLLKNACEAMEGAPHPRVTLAVVEENGMHVVSVTDSGAGVPLDVARTIFEWSESDKKDGMGVGLSICRTIVEAHGGRIWLANSGPQGSTFSFSVPVHHAAPRT
jgi:two-component system sensor kinase FixL